MIICHVGIKGTHCILTRYGVRKMQVFHRITQINIVVDITATSKYSSLDFSKIYTYVPTAMIEKICNLKQNQPVQRATNISDLNVHGANRLLFILYILYKITNYLKKLSFSE